MDLNTYLAMYRIKKQDFAEKVGISPVHLSRILKGKHRKKATLDKIRDLTNGKVIRPWPKDENPIT